MKGGAPLKTRLEQAGTGRHSGPTESEATLARRRMLVPTLVLSGSLMAVVSSLGAPLIPTLSQADGVSLSTGEWILTITLLTGALATPVMGRLADRAPPADRDPRRPRRGRRRLRGLGGVERVHRADHRPGPAR